MKVANVHITRCTWVGTANPLMPYAGGTTKISDAKVDVVSTDATLAPFAKADGCGDGRATIGQIQ